MIRYLLPCLTLCSLLTIVGCGSYTRSERDIYTVTHSDTVVTERVQNQPGDRDNGIIYPSTRSITMARTVNQQDSVVDRHYPAFIRLGLFEGIGLIGSSVQGANSSYTGLFGVYYDISRVLFGASTDTTQSAIFSGYIYRFGIGEWKLNWFDNDPGWSWGVTSAEIIRPDGDNSHGLVGAGVLTLNKRFFFRSLIPYLTIRPSISLSALPSQYVNASVSAEIGSIGGVNLRAYAGYAFGTSLLSNPAQFVNFPYFGIGASVLDFLNREEELNVEWKYHEHSAWEIGGLDFTLLGSGASRSAFAPDQAGDKIPVIKGGTARVAYASVALPVLNYRLSLGTALLNAVVLGADEYGFGILPLRLTYHWNPFGNTFVIEPFFEYNFAPSTFAHMGMRFLMPVGDQMSVQVVAGWASGNTGAGVPNPFPGQPDLGTSIDGTVKFGSSPNFSAFYIGIGASLLDKLFGRGDLRYGKGYPHE
ncbi:MAG: hypothetical protein NTX15_10420 [Candidatus Kapabacteria bacterium]|nr:hypothetical protein [Candidatus Kapabacteria bacterium]